MISAVEVAVAMEVLTLTAACGDLVMIQGIGLFRPLPHGSVTQVIPLSWSGITETAG